MVVIIETPERMLERVLGREALLRCDENLSQRRRGGLELAWMYQFVHVSAEAKPEHRRRRVPRYRRYPVLFYLFGEAAFLAVAAAWVKDLSWHAFLAVDKLNPVWLVEA